jgi:lipopolysaccharide export system permease protein
MGLAEGSLSRERRDLSTGTLYRYLFRKALFMCTAACTGLTLLVLLSMLFGSLGMFAEHNTDLYTIARFMLFSIPRMIYWVLPFSVCVGIIATQASFARHTETIAMQASSISFFRLIVPYLQVGLIAMIIMVFFSFYLYPVAQRQADRLENVDIRKKDVTGSFSVNGGRFKVGEDIYYLDHLDISKGIMHHVNCYRIVAGRLVSIIRADTAVWDGRIWKTENMELINLSTIGIQMERPASALPLNRGPADLVTAQPNPEALTLKELVEYRSYLKQEDIQSVSLDTNFYSRITFAVAPFIMTLLVLPFGMRFPRTGGIARGISVGIILGLAYWALHSAMTGIGMSGYIHPIAAACTADAVAMTAGITLLVMRRDTYG